MLISAFRLHRLHNVHHAVYCDWWSRSVVCQSVCHAAALCKNGWTDRSSVRGGYFCWSKEHCIRWGSRSHYGEGGSMRPFQITLTRCCGVGCSYMLQLVRLWRLNGVVEEGFVAARSCLRCCRCSDQVARTILNETGCCMLHGGITDWPAAHIEAALVALINPRLILSRCCRWPGKVLGCPASTADVARWLATSAVQCTHYTRRRNVQDQWSMSCKPAGVRHFTSVSAECRPPDHPRRATRRGEVGPRWVGQVGWRPRPSVVKAR